MNASKVLNGVVVLPDNDVLGRIDGLSLRVSSHIIIRILHIVEAKKICKRTANFIVMHSKDKLE